MPSGLQTMSHGVMYLMGLGVLLMFLIFSARCGSGGDGDDSASVRGGTTGGFGGK